MLNQKVNISGNNVISCSLEANVVRCGEIKTINDDDLNALTLTQLTANESIIDLRTEESVDNMHLKVKGFSYIGLSTTNNNTLYKDTTIDGILTTGNTTVNEDLTITGNLTYNGDSSSDSYTKTEIDYKLFLKVNQSDGGNVALTGNLDVGQDQAQTSIKACINHIGKTGYVEMEARWANQGFTHVKSNHTAGELPFAVKDSLKDKMYVFEK